MGNRPPWTHLISVRPCCCLLTSATTFKPYKTGKHVVNRFRNSGNLVALVWLRPRPPSHIHHKYIQVNFGGAPNSRMRAIECLRWVLLGAVSVVLATQEKDMEAVVWSGGKTIYPSGEVHYNGLSTRCQILDHFAILAIPKLKPDVRSTLCKLDMTRKIGGSHEYVLTPFLPHEPADPESCERLQSVVDVVIDPTNNVYALDVGAMFRPKNEGEHPHVCPPKVVAYHVATAKKLHEINLLPYVGPMSRLQFVIVDFDQDGKPFVFVSDAGTKAVIVCDVEQQKVERVELPEHAINEFQPRDVLYVVLIRKADGRNLIYFTYRSAENMWCIESHHLIHDRTMAKAYEVGKKPAKMIILGTDDWDCIYFRYENEPKVFKWNTSTPFNEKNFVVVHTSTTGLTPTHAIADYKNGVMRLCESNLVEYLKPDFPTQKAECSLTVMAVTEHPDMPHMSEL